MGTEVGTKWELKVGTGNSSGGNNPHINVGTVPTEFPPLFPPLTVGRKESCGEVGTRNRIHVCESPRTPLDARAPEGAPRGLWEHTHAPMVRCSRLHGSFRARTRREARGNSHVIDHSWFPESGLFAPWARCGPGGVFLANRRGISRRGPNGRALGATLCYVTMEDRT